MNATVLDDAGKAVEMAMGCYGIGVTRVIAAAIEQNHDEKGIIWPDAIAPWRIAIVPIGYGKSERVRECADGLYQALLDAGYEVLIDDRDERPGVMFADLELLGIPHRVVIGERSLDRGVAEYRHRSSGDERELGLDNLATELSGILDS